MNEKINVKYISLNGKLLSVEKDGLYFDNKRVGVLFTTPPERSNSPGTVGDIAYDTQYFYICIQANKWIRTALAEW